MDVGQEIIDDPGDGYIIYIQLVPFDKEQKQIKRTFKLG